MYLIVGLGNPGEKYSNNRHNVGFMAIDVLAGKLGVELKKLKYKSLIAESRIGIEKVVLMKPQTYMNLSGVAIAEAVNFYKLDPSRIIVIYDDIDVNIGEVRLRKKGSAGTHNGMRSIVSSLGFGDFIRFRVGIGNKAKDKDLISYVLGNMDCIEKEYIDSALKLVSEGIDIIIEKDIEHAMNEVNRKSKKQFMSNEKNIDL